MRLWKWIILPIMLLTAGCASLRGGGPLTPDQTTMAFFDALQRVDNQTAYGLLGKGLSQRISYDQFDQFMKILREEWGGIETEETVSYPFRPRMGEQEFIPLRVDKKQIKRYSFTVTYQSAEINFDLTVAPENGVNKIVFFSLWDPSSVHVTPRIEEKIKELFGQDTDIGDNNS